MDVTTRMEAYREQIRKEGYRQERQTIRYIVGAALLIVLMLSFSFAFGRLSTTDIHSEVAGTQVPTGLHCTEDEVIYFIDNNRLGCVHIETIAFGTTH